MSSPDPGTLKDEDKKAPGKLWPCFSWGSDTYMPLTWGLQSCPWCQVLSGVQQARTLAPRTRRAPTLKTDFLSPLQNHQDSPAPALGLSWDGEEGRAFSIQSCRRRPTEVSRGPRCHISVPGPQWDRT